MNSSTSAFWYRPFWLQILPILGAMVLILLAYFYFYWQPTALKLVKLENEILTIETQLRQIQITQQQLPSLERLDAQLTELNNPINFPKQDPSEFITHLQQAITQTNVVLNRLQPSTGTETNEQSYIIEIQGDYPKIYRFIDALVSPQTDQIRLFSGVSFTPHNGQLAATLTISFIKDDKNDVQ